LKQQFFSPCFIKVFLIKNIVNSRSVVNSRREKEKPRGRKKMSEYTTTLALGSVLVVLFDVYAYYRYKYSEEVLENALRARKLAEAAKRFEEEHALEKTGETQGISSIEFQHGFGEASGLTQLETIPVSFDELKRASGVSSAEQEKELLKLKDELAAMSEQLATLKKQSNKREEKESEYEPSDTRNNNFNPNDYNANAASEDYHINAISFAEKNEESEESEQSIITQNENTEQNKPREQNKYGENGESELEKNHESFNDWEKQLEQTTLKHGQSADEASGLSESASTFEEKIDSEKLTESLKQTPTPLEQDLTTEEEPEEEFEKPEKEFKKPEQKSKTTTKTQKNPTKKTFKTPQKNKTKKTLTPHKKNSEKTKRKEKHKNKAKSVKQTKKHKA